MQFSNAMPRWNWGGKLQLELRFMFELSLSCWFLPQVSRTYSTWFTCTVRRKTWSDANYSETLGPPISCSKTPSQGQCQGQSKGQISINVTKRWTSLPLTAIFRQKQKSCSSSPKMERFTPLLVLTCFDCHANVQVFWEMGVVLSHQFDFIAAKTQNPESLQTQVCNCKFPCFHCTLLLFQSTLFTTNHQRKHYNLQTWFKDSLICRTGFVVVLLIWTCHFFSPHKSPS